MLDHVSVAVRDQRTSAAAIQAGWIDSGPPGPRRAEMTPYYAAFVQDPDGNKLEAATFPRNA